ncbi:MAG: 30S ribosomal protein S11 [Patescibacteria group bacterium]
MGKKRIIQKSQEELIREREKVDAAVSKESKVSFRSLKEGRVYISSSYNNTLMTLTNARGEVLLWKSSGALGFKGAKKATSFAASKVAEAFAEGARKLGIEQISVFIKGIGSGRDSALKSLANKGMDITSIKDITPIPHNGCRPKKSRRV